MARHSEAPAQSSIAKKPGVLSGQRYLARHATLRATTNLGRLQTGPLKSPERDHSDQKT